MQFTLVLLLVFNLLLVTVLGDSIFRKVPPSRHNFHLRGREAIMEAVYTRMQKQIDDNKKRAISLQKSLAHTGKPHMVLKEMPNPITGKIELKWVLEKN